MPSLATLLRADRRQLTQLKHARAHQQLPALQRTAIPQLTALVRVEERRIAYQHAHPGQLPAD
jgi:hypothetical protein